MSAADIEMWIDGVRDAVDDKEGLSPQERIEALQELIEYIGNISIPDAKAAMPKPRRRVRAKAGAK